MRSLNEVENLCADSGLSFPEAVIRLASQEEGRSSSSLLELMKTRLSDMQRSVREALSGTWDGALSKDQTESLSGYIERGNSISGPFLLRACQIAMSVASYNSCMGRIVAAPTAGSCGILPGVLFSWSEYHDTSDEELLYALVTAAGIGQVIASRATLAGAEGGCQAECGAAAAMAAGSMVFLNKGGPNRIIQASALVLKSILGLVCDPVAGLVEIPCIKRNGSLVSLAAICADMALAGISSSIPCDEIIDAMGSVGRSLPESLKETAQGGIAATPAARKMAEKVNS